LSALGQEKDKVKALDAGAEYSGETHYLRVYMAQLRRKLEKNPAQPKFLIKEPGVGYRLKVS
jgi:two-component system KDP operon response regulator KdpE